MYAGFIYSENCPSLSFTASWLMASFYRKCGFSRWIENSTGWIYSCWLVERWSHDYHLVKLVSGWLWQPRKSFSITREKSSKIFSTSVCIGVDHEELLELKQFEKNIFLTRRVRIIFYFLLLITSTAASKLYGNLRHIIVTSCRAKGKYHFSFFLKKHLEA